MLWQGSVTGACERAHGRRIKQTGEEGKGLGIVKSKAFQEKKNDV